MKSKFFLTTALVCGALFCFAAFADLSGKWSTSFKTQDGTEFPLTYTFKIDGEKLTGTVGSSQGDIEMTDGKITGTDFSFTVSVNGTDVKNVGKYYAAADSAGIDVDFGGMKSHLALKRAN
jgi:hypothetical protein